MGASICHRRRWPWVEDPKTDVAGQGFFVFCRGWFQISDGIVEREREVGAAGWVSEK